MLSFANLFTVLFLLALCLSVVLQLWLAQRQVRHVTLHRASVPAHFAGRIALAAHQKAADYTVARTRLSAVDVLVDTCVLLALTLGGGLWAAAAWTSTLPLDPLWQDVLLIVGVTVATGVVALPLSWYRTFVVEQRFGFNHLRYRVRDVCRSHL
jgi:STE24 endopeptidase